MIRLIIFIFILNTFMMPASAMVACDDMGESNTVMMSSVGSSTMPDMGCDTPEKATCCTIQCISSSCAVMTIPLPSSEKSFISIVAGNDQFQSGLAYFYTITLPVKTPPPLV